MKGICRILLLKDDGIKKTPFDAKIYHSDENFPRLNKFSLNFPSLNLIFDSESNKKGPSDIFWRHEPE